MENSKIDFWQSVEDVHSNKAIWEEVYSASEASPYLSYEWFTTALKYFQGGNRLMIGVVKNDEKPVAIVPLEIAKEKVGPITVNVLRFVLEGWSLRNGAIAENKIDQFSVIQKVIGAARLYDPSWKYCRLSSIPDNIQLCEAKSTGDTASFQRTISMRRRSVVIEIPKTWEAYKKTLSNRQRKHLPLKINTLERKGNVRLLRLGLNSETDQANLSILMNDAVSVSKKSWQHSTPEGWAISDPKTGDFFFEVSEELAAKSMLDLSVLYLDDRPISFIWGAARWPRSTMYKIGYDKSYSEVNAGFVHIAKYIMDSIDRGLTEIDFGTGFFEYKSSWGKRYDELLDVFYYAPGILPSIIRKARLTLHAIKK